MTKGEKKHGFFGKIISGLNYASHFSKGIFPSITDGAEKILDNLDKRLIVVEERIIRRAYTFSIISLGIIFLIFAFFFYLKDFLNLNNSIAFFYIGTFIFIAGLLLQIRGSGK